MEEGRAGWAGGTRRNEAKSHDNNANLRLMKEDDWKTKLNELHLWERTENREPETEADCNGELLARVGRLCGLWGMLLQIHNYMRLMSLLKLQQHVAGLQSVARYLKKADARANNDRHIILTHISQLCWQRQEKGTNDYTHTHTHTQAKIKPSYFSLDICPIITADSGSFQLSNVSRQQHFHNAPSQIYIWLCLVKQITTTNKLHRNQSERRPTKGTAADATDTFTDTFRDTDIDSYLAYLSPALPTAFPSEKNSPKERCMWNAIQKIII